MTTENNFSENEENKLNTEETSNVKPEETTLENEAEKTETSEPSSEEEQSAEPEVLHETDSEEEEEEPNHHEDERSVEVLASEMEKIVNKSNAGEEHKEFNNLKNLALKKISEEKDEHKQAHHDNGNEEESFSWEHALQSKINTLINVFKEKYDIFQKHQEEKHAENFEGRKKIIEELKNLYTNTEAGTNLFKAIREIKEKWKNAGQVAKSEFRLLNNDYFHHLNQFYQMLDLNKEYLEQEYAHNLETRKHIIKRAKELENEPLVQKALNELQYLHKLWKEEAEPVAEEFREATWEEFREVSNKIHQRKSELSAILEEEQNKNLERKNEIIATIKSFVTPEKEPNHNYWQNAIKKVEELRNEFLKLGSVPRKLSNQNWADFKTILREFNSKKNEYYKGLKGSQQTNLDAKLKLIQTAKDNMLSEDWDTAVPLFKKLQDEWSKIGHVPRSMANKVWDEFREACNTFFNNFREKNNASTDNWKSNYKQKMAILEELKTITDEEGSVERIEALKTAWNNIGKVPRDKMNINTEFNKTLRDKLKLNRINEYDLKEEGLSENQLTDKARKIKNQLADLEAEVVKLENNLGFFNNPSRENPLLKDTFDKIDEKKSQIESLKQSLHNIIAGE
ncbi:MAG: DUF349 domain-containing protein [Bergeyella sp.]